MRPVCAPLGRVRAVGSVFEMLSPGLSCGTRLSLSLCRLLQDAPGRELEEASSSVSSRAQDREGSRVHVVRAPQPALAALLPTAAHLLMVECGVLERQPQSLGHAAGGRNRQRGQGGPLQTRLSEMQSGQSGHRTPEAQTPGSFQFF